jgi:RimJ/RimL family protein N-acetyltransferase
MQKGDRDNHTTSINLVLLSYGQVQSYLAMFSPMVQSLVHVSSVSAEQAYVLYRIGQNAAAPFFYGIIEQLSYQLIGAIDIRDPFTSAGQLYCWLNEQFWGRGYIQQAIALAAQDYFRCTQERYFNAHVDVANLRSYYALKKAGFADYGFYNGPRGRQYNLILRKKPQYP